jgi:hypothetical protein
MRVINFLLTAVCACLFSCSNIYVQKLRTANHFKSKHEVNAKASIGLPSYNGVLAGSISDHIMVQASATKSYYGNLNARDTARAGGMMLSMTHQFWDAGLGYFSVKENESFEIHGGFGKGRSSSFNPPPTGNENRIARMINTTYHAFYLQPAFATTRANGLRVGFACRFTVLKFDTYEDNRPKGKFDPDDFSLFVEPALDLRWNIKESPLYVFNNAGLSFKAPKIFGFGYWPVDVQIGLGIHINEH